MVAAAVLAGDAASRLLCAVLLRLPLLLELFFLQLLLLERKFFRPPFIFRGFPRLFCTRLFEQLVCCLHFNYPLARPAAAITMADIVEAVEGPIALTACVEGEDCAVDHTCSVRPHWPLINEALRGALADIPLTQLAQQREIA